MAVGRGRSREIGTEWKCGCGHAAVEGGGGGGCGGGYGGGCRGGVTSEQSRATPVRVKEQMSRSSVWGEPASQRVQRPTWAGEKESKGISGSRRE